MSAVGSSLDARVDALARELSNWGRWGDADEVGTLNLITTEKRRRAAACVRSGTAISLALELRSDQPQPVGSGRLNPQHMMVETGSDAAVQEAVSAYSDDVLAMSVHAASHWDALSHVFHRGLMYNARSCTEVTSAGARANDIVGYSDRLVTRGVLVDVARHHGVAALAPDHEVTVQELESALAAQCVELEAGDALLVRTGQLGRIAASSDWADFTEVGPRLPLEPGIGLDSLSWLQAMGVAAIACDNWAVEHIHAASERLPVHEVAIVHMGLPLGEIFELDALAEACAGDGHYDFLLSAGPLPIRGGVGGPVNPIAVR
ncbi:MAG TPA: cyclase family protein [Solirubrobacteraceae bacterium]|nr:cyclase family protein [Solirubrobacteraceae bacterium]